MTEKSNDIETKNETKNQPKRLGNEENDENHLMIDKLAAANAVSGGGFSPSVGGGARYSDTGSLGVDAALRAVANQSTRMHGSMPCLGQRS
jgi:hypothetical protein